MTSVMVRATLLIAVRARMVPRSGCGERRGTNQCDVQCSDHR